MNLPLPVAVGIWVVIGALLLVVVVTGRRRLTGRTAGLVPAPPAVPTELDPPSAGPFSGTYVTSTLAGDWLARVGAHGLGDRSNATLTIRSDGAGAGVLVERDGAPDLFVPAAAVEAVALSPGMAGKFVGRDRIVVVTWRVPGSAMAPGDGRSVETAPDATVRLDTGFLPRHRADVAAVLDAARALVPPPDGPAHGNTVTS